MRFAGKLQSEILGILLNGERYGRDIRKEFKKRTGDEMPLGSLYVTLARLEDAKLIRHRFGEKTHEYGGNRRKYYELTAAGHRAADAIQSLRGVRDA